MQLFFSCNNNAKNVLKIHRICFQVLTCINNLTNRLRKNRSQRLCATGIQRLKACLIGLRWQIRRTIFLFILATWNILTNSRTSIPKIKTGKRCSATFSSRAFGYLNYLWRLIQQLSRGTKNGRNIAKREDIEFSYSQSRLFSQ